VTVYDLYDPAHGAHVTPGHASLVHSERRKAVEFWTSQLERRKREDKITVTSEGTHWHVTVSPQQHKIPHRQRLLTSTYGAYTTCLVRHFNYIGIQMDQKTKMTRTPG